jgi:hypothetical protein
MQVESFVPFDPRRFFQLPAASNAEGSRVDTRVSGFSLSDDFSGRLSVSTAEGDTITLTTALEADFRTGTYHSRVEADPSAASVGAETAQLAIRRDFGVVVEGNLNEQELHDLGTLFQNISKIFRGFIAGQPEHVLTQTAALAERLGGLGTLSSLDLSVEVVRSVTVVAAASDTPGGAPVTAAAIPLLSNGTTASTPSFDSTEGHGLPLLGADAQLASLLQRVFDALKEAETELQKFQKYLPDFFGKLHEELLKETPKEPEPQVTEQVPREGPAPIESSHLFTAYSSLNLSAVSFSVHS